MRHGFNAAKAREGSGLIQSANHRHRRQRHVADRMLGVIAGPPSLGEPVLSSVVSIILTARMLVCRNDSAGAVSICDA